MQSLLGDIRDIEGVKNVRKQSGPVLKVELFSRELKGSEAEEIMGDLRKISRNLREKMDEAREDGDIPGWEWVIKPEKRYQERSLGGNVTDRKPKGHKPAYYRISIE